MNRRTLLTSLLGFLGLSKIAPAEKCVPTIVGFDPAFGHPESVIVVWCNMGADGVMTYAASSRNPKELSREELLKAIADAELLQKQVPPLPSWSRTIGPKWEDVRI